MNRALITLIAALAAAPAAAQTLPDLDTDDDGVIDQAEFRQMISEEGLFERWDEDDDEQISPAEFAGGLFALWNRDEDGSLGPQDWASGAELWFGEDAAQLSFDDWDEDADGSISRQEFVTAFQETELFARLQAAGDADELVDRDELATALFGVADADEDMFLGEDEDFFLVDLIELFNAPDDGDGDVAEIEADAPALDPGDVNIDEDLVDMPDDLVPEGVEFVGLPIPCGTDQTGSCQEIAQRFCSVLALGEPLDFLELDGRIHVVRCDNAF